MGQFQGVCGLQAQSPGLLSHELPSSALWAGHVMLSAPLPSLRPSGRWEKHPAKADGHEAGDPAPQGPPAARLSSCSAPLSEPALPSLQVLQGARGCCSWATKPRGQAVSRGSCLPAEKQGTHLRGKVGEQLPWAPHYRSGGLALTGAWTSKISPGFYWWPFSSLGGPSTLKLAWLGGCPHPRPQWVRGRGQGRARPTTERGIGGCGHRGQHKVTGSWESRAREHIDCMWPRQTRS